jgi:hypothetical protein
MCDVWFRKFVVEWCWDEIEKDPQKSLLHQVALDLFVVKGHSSLQCRWNEHFSFSYIVDCIEESDGPHYHIILPFLASCSPTPKFLFDLLNYSFCICNRKEDCDCNSTSTPKSILNFAIVDGDSTITYYRITKGLVPLCEVKIEQQITNEIPNSKKRKK